MLDLQYGVLRKDLINILAIQQLIKFMINKNYKRLSKDQYFIALSFLTSKRSHDSETQHGCVLVKDDIVISTGYNGFLRNSDDDNIPNTRPEKYKYIIHAEANAILNAAKIGISLDKSAAYITGKPCIECAKKMIQSGITRWFCADTTHSKLEDEKDFLEYLIKSHNVTIIPINLDKDLSNFFKNGW